MSSFKASVVSAGSTRASEIAVNQLEVTLSYHHHLLPSLRAAPSIDTFIHFHTLFLLTFLNNRALFSPTYYVYDGIVFSLNFISGV